MKTIACLGSLLLLVSLAQAYPASEFTLINWEDAAIAAKELQHRQMRVLCEDFNGFANHGNCAARCIISGRTSGYCNGQGVCI
ncbi:hypothetical protein ACLKA7_014134 [Drosophila subpalustris]